MSHSRSPGALISDHYSSGDLLSAIEAGLRSLGLTPDEVTAEELAPVEAFHTGGRRATRALCAQLDLDPGSRVLDIGCGIGGTARYLAESTGCRVIGVDLTTEFVRVARALTEWTGQSGRVAFHVADASSLPFESQSFDAAVQLHVGMNVPDKETLFNEVFRVLRPGGTLAIYDIMAVTDNEFDFPVPWSTGAPMSHVADPAVYRTALEDSGFVLLAQRDRTEFVLGYFDALAARSRRGGGPPPLGPHLHMGGDARAMTSNMVAAMAAGDLAPTEMICRRP